MLGMENMEMMHPVASEMDIFRSTVDLDSACRAEHDDSPFVGSYRVIIFFYGMYGWSRFMLYFFSCYIWLDYHVWPTVDIKPLAYYVEHVMLLLTISSYDGCGMIVYLSKLVVIYDALIYFIAPHV